MAKSGSFAGKLFRIIICFMCLCCAFTAAVYSYGQMKEYNVLKAEEAKLLKNIDGEHALHEELELELEYNMTEVYIEKIAREKLGLVKGSDIIFENVNK